MAPSISPTQPPAPEGAVVRTLVICNKKGLHARASAKFVQTVEKFDAEVRVMRCGETVGGTSIMGLMMLAAAPGTVDHRRGDRPGGRRSHRGFGGADQFAFRRSRLIRLPI